MSGSGIGGMPEKIEALERRVSALEKQRAARIEKLEAVVRAYQMWAGMIEHPYAHSVDCPCNTCVLRRSSLRAALAVERREEDK